MRRIFNSGCDVTGKGLLMRGYNPGCVVSRRELLRRCYASRNQLFWSNQHCMKSKLLNTDHVIACLKYSPVCIYTENTKTASNNADKSFRPEELAILTYTLLLAQFYYKPGRLSFVPKNRCREQIQYPVLDS